MKLTEISKKKLLTAANTVYLAYTALDFFKSRVFNTAAGEISLYDLCNQALINKKYEQIVVINNVNYRLTLSPGDDNTFKVQLSRPVGSITAPVIKKIAAYEDQEALNLLANQEFTLQVSDSTSKPVVTNRINQDYVIGGQGKIDLYRTHLVTLHNIIEKIQSEEDISNLLVALATGTGKTFVQALWMLILSLSDNNGVFAIPGKLITQFTKDLKRFLPDSLVNKMLLLRDNEDNQQVVEAIKSMAQPEGKKTIVIGSADFLLDKHYQELIDAHPDQTFLSFDEQHLIMKHERRSVRLIELAKQKLSMFLTATPNQETYELSGNKPVAIMSSGQKQQAGQGQFPRLLTHNARNISDRNTLKDFRFWTFDFWATIFKGFLLSLTNSIQEEQSSAAVSLVEDLPFYYFRKEGEENVRWRLQVPAARKMLCIIDDNEDLVNFCYALEQAHSDRRDVYRNGNIVNRTGVAQFFGIPDVEKEVIREDMRNKRADYLSSLKEDERAIGERLANKTLARQLQDNILHNLIEYVLTDITGLDEIEHNRLRKKDMNAFKQMVVNKFALRTADYYQQKLAKDIDAEGAEILGEILADFSNVMQRMINGSFSHSQEENEQNLADFIDNWALYDQLLHNIQDNYELNRKFENYSRSHLIMGLMTGMNDAETPVKESHPFSGLDQNSYRLYDSNGLLVSNAKKRKRTSLEILNDISTETAFTPNYLNISEDIADNYVRLGFVGIYVSNKKTEGFSDRNLHTVINIAEHKLSPNNSPEAQIQAIGRDRGLDDTIIPAYIHSLGRNEQTVFDLENLKSDDYYPALFAAQDKFNKEYIQILGRGVSKKIITWIHTNLEGDETLDPERLKRQVLRYIAQALRDINSKNSHKIELSRAQLAEVVSYVMDGVNQEIEHVNKPYTISTFISLLGHVLNFLSECYYAVKRIPAAWKLFKFSWFGARTAVQSEVAPKHADDVYLKILSNTSFKNIIAHVSSAFEFKNWLSRKVNGIQSHILKNLESYVTTELFEQFKVHQKQTIEPLLVKMVVDSKKERVAAALEAFPHLIPLLKANLATLFRVMGSNENQLEPHVLAVLQQIPSLEALVIEDIVNYPKFMENLLSQLAQEPEKILLNDPKVREELAIKLGNYLKGDFLKYLSAFVAYPNVLRIKESLGNEQAAQQFVHHCLTKLLNKDLEFSPIAFLSELRNYFKIEGCNRLDEDLDSLFVEFKRLQDETAKNLFQSLDEPHLVQLSSIIQQQLLPLLVNIYPLEHRDTLFREASNSVTIKKLIKEHGNELFTLMQANRDELPDFIFSKLCSTPLPKPINVSQQIQTAQEFVTQQFQAIMQKNVANLLWKKLINPASWSTKREYLYDTAIANLLRSDEFLNAISIMLPYGHWLQLKSKIKEDEQEVLSIARVIIDKVTKGSASEMSAQGLLELFNQQFNTKLVQSDQALSQVEQSFVSFAKEISASPLVALDPAIQSQYVQLTSSQLKPILASFINEDAKKEQFLAMKWDDKKLIEFLTRNMNVLSSLPGQNESQLKQTVLTLINQSVPEESKLTLEDMIDPRVKAADSSKLLVKEIQKIALPIFISSSVFSNLMKNAFNTQDFELIMTYLNSPKQMDPLVEQIIAKGIEPFDTKSILDLIKSSDPTLNAIATIDERINSLSKYFRAQVELGERALDKEKVITLLGDVVAPVLFHEQFISIIDEVIGFLDEQDLTVMFEAMNKANPAEEAKQLIAFIEVIRRQDKETLMNQFLASPTDAATTDLERLPGKRMMEHIHDLVEEILDCHCYYHQQDRKGFEGGETDPKLINRMSPELCDIRVQSDGSFFSGFSRKIFYIQGIRNGIGTSGQVNADSNQHIVKILQRVNSHILRPLWWSTNVSNITHSLIKMCRNVVQGMVSGYFVVINGVKSALNYINDSDYFVISKKHPDSEEYNDTAFAYSATMNQLEPLNAEQVSKKDCKRDVVVKLEEFVAKRSTRPGFFRDVGEHFVADSGTEDLSPKM